MSKRYITATILALATGGVNAWAQDISPAPRLVVNIAIDQLRTDFLESFDALYGDGGFRKVMRSGLFYANVDYPFSPVDRASAIAAINTGAAPAINGITAERWFDRATLRPVSCADDAAYPGLLTPETASAQSVMTTTLSDELKVATKGRAVVYSVAEMKDAAVIPAGHCADGAFWVNARENCWCTSTYYSKKTPKWLEAYNLYNSPYKKNSNVNDQITDLALKCASVNSMGKDDTTDMLFVTYNAAPSIGRDGDEDCRDAYVQIDRGLDRLITSLEAEVGAGKVLFVITGTGRYESLKSPDRKYRLPGGTIYINRTANLLNMYLGALYGSDKYVEGYLNGNIYLNTKVIDAKRLSISDVTNVSAAFARQCQGVANVYSGVGLALSSSPEAQKARNGNYLSRCGDIIIEAAPGWSIADEDTQQQYSQYYGYLPTPVIFYGYNLKGHKVGAPAQAAAISPTIAKTINIRAPNACKSAPLF